MTMSTWDKTELGQLFPQCQTLKDVIASIETAFSKKGEVICEIHVNGMLIDEEGEKKFGESSATEIETISVRSNRPDSLIRDAIESTLVFIPDLERASLSAAEKYRSSDLQAAQKSFNEVLEGCQWLFDTLMHVRGAASGIDQPISQAERWYEAEKLIGRVVKELSGAYGNSDYVLVADVLEYEVTGALAVWREVIESEKLKR